MRYWCWGKHGEERYQWSIDHTHPHALNGCDCHFNLRAMHLQCNISKGAKL
jgi:hypothetical protein